MPCAITYFYTEIHESFAPKRKTNAQNRCTSVILSRSKRAVDSMHTQIQISTVGDFFISVCTHTPECSCFFFASFDYLIKCNSTFSLSAFLSVDSQWILSTLFFIIVSPLVAMGLDFFFDFTIAKSITFTQTLYYPRCTLWTISYSLRKSTMEKKREKDPVKFIAKIIAHRDNFRNGMLKTIKTFVLSIEFWTRRS